MRAPWSQPLGIWPLSCFWSTHGAEKIFDDLEHSTPSPAVCIGRQLSDSISCLNSCHWGPCSPLPLKLTSLQPPRSPCEPSPAFPASASRGLARSPHLLWGHLFHLRFWGFYKKEEELLLLRKENDKLQVSVQNRKGRSDLERAKPKPQKIIYPVSLVVKQQTRVTLDCLAWKLGRPNVPDWKVIGATIICASSTLAEGENWEIPMGISGQHPGYFHPIPVFLGRGWHLLGAGVDSTEVGRWNDTKSTAGVCKHKTILPLNLKPNWIFGKGSLHQWPKQWPHPGQDGCPRGRNLGSELPRAQSLPRASL